MKLKVISLNIDHITFNECIQTVLHAGLNKTTSYVCFANAHMVIEAQQDKNYQQKVNNAMLVVADGKPVATACKWLYKKNQERIAGMDFFPAILEEINKIPGKIFLYGSTEDVLNALRAKIKDQYPSVTIAGSISPPFRELTIPEQQDHITTINNSGAEFVMVSLGCPKQEKWMAENSRYINAALLGLGGAFAVIAGIRKRSPKWMQNSGLEWLHRLSQEPLRLFKRYLFTNTMFISLLAKQLGKKIFS